MMLHGTEFKNPKYREEFDYKSKFRIVPLNFGEYEDKKIFDYEEVGIQNKDLSFDDYLYLRVIALLVESVHNGRPFNEFFLYAKTYGIQPASLLKILYDNIKQSSKNIQNLITAFIDETKGELWDSEEKLLEFYRKDENYLKLKNGELGGNLIYKYKSRNLVENSNDWIDIFEKQLSKEISSKNLKNFDQIKNELSELSNFCRLKINGLLKPSINTSPISHDFGYNIIDWIDNYEIDNDLKNYSLDNKQKFIFSYTKEQLQIRDDVFKRYGTSINALSKIFTRISNLESQFRKVRNENDNYFRDVYKKVGENFTRYALSN